jgi:phosphoribosylanthranilate isomerase
MPIRVKICGITNREDAHHAVQAGADALGFVFYPPSPRNVSAAHAAKIIASLPPLVARVGVFVDPNAAQVQQIIDECGIDTLQFHGEEKPEFCRQFRLKVIKGFRIRDDVSLMATAPYSDVTWLLDSYVPGLPGGTGARFNWELALKTARQHTVILAGGLTPENVAHAIRAVRPYGVDVSSGVESAPGQKDSMKVSAFINAARRAV